MNATKQASSVAAREAAATIPVYGQLPFVPARAEGCDIITEDGRRILDFPMAVTLSPPSATDTLAW